MKGRVAVSQGHHQPMEIREYPVAPPPDDEILVKVTAAGICGSDLHMWRGEFLGFHAPGCVPGHEMAGRVAALGKNRKTDTLGRPLKEGDRIAYAYFQPCGSCWACLTRSAGCPNRYWKRGGKSATEAPHFWGAYGDYYYLGADQWVFKVPDELSDAVVAPVNCALSQMIYGLNKIQVWLGDTVVIQGAGGLGLNACAVAKSMGAGTVVAIDRIPGRLEMAKAFGADETIDLNEYPTKEARVERVKQLTSGVGADACVEVVGVPAVVQEGIEMLRIGGRYLLVGNIVPGLPAEIVPHDLTRTPRYVQGVVSYEGWVLPRALDWLVRVKDQYPFDKLVSHTYPLEQINQAFEQAEWLGKTGQVLRAFVTM
ncbi:MAG: zinc-binding dehydrogenase [Chloroflexi bacterium]|nr:zinc-binding dehydrogenase [Chloroflexota bacterium]